MHYPDNERDCRRVRREHEYKRECLMKRLQRMPDRDFEMYVNDWEKKRGEKN